MAFGGDRLGDGNQVMARGSFAMHYFSFSTVFLFTFAHCFVTSWSFSSFSGIG